MNLKIFTKKRLIIIGVVILVLFILAYCSAKSKSNNQIQLVDTIKKQDITSEVITTGQLQPIKQTTVGAQVTGEIKKLYIDIGDHVEKGQLIAELDPTVQENNLAKARDSVTSAKADLSTLNRKLAVAKADASNYAILYKNGAASKTDYDKYLTTLKETSNSVIQAKAKINQTELELENSAKDLSYTKIVAPMDGVVVSLPVEVGQTLTAGYNTPTIAQIADIDKMTIKAQISEADIYNIKQGQAATFTILGNTSKKYNAVVDVVHPAPTYVSDDSTTTTTTYYYTTLNVNDIDPSFRVNMTVNVTIKTDSKNNVIAVPSSSITTKDGKSYIKMLNQKGEAREQEIKTGYTNGTMTEVTSGLKVGDKIVKETLEKEK